MSIKIHHKQPIATHGMTREFSEEVHGADFEKIARSYISRYGDNVASVEGLDDGDTPTNEEVELPTDEDLGEEEEIEQKRFCEFCDSKGVRHKANCKRPLDAE